MRYITQDANNDWTMTGTASDVLTDNVEAVRQAVRSRLLLFLGEWFLAPMSGVPWSEKIAGFSSQGARDIVLKETILGTPGVTGIANYSSALNLKTRRFSVSCIVLSLYGSIEIAPPVNLPTSGFGVGPFGEGEFGV